MTDNQTQAKDEARRKLADEIETFCQLRSGATRDGFPYAAHFIGRDLAHLVNTNCDLILAALRADPARGAASEEQIAKALRQSDIDAGTLGGEYRSGVPIPYDHEPPHLRKTWERYAAAIRALPAAQGGGE